MNCFIRAYDCEVFFSLVSKTDTGKINVLLNWVQNNIRYVAFEHGIQGKMAMVEDGDYYLMLRTPAYPPSHNLTQLISRYVIEGGRLTGQSALSFSGEAKYAMTASIRYTRKTDTDRYLRNYLKCNNPSDSILDMDIKGIETGPENLSISYKDLRPSCVRSFSDELYIDPDVFKDFAVLTVDTLKRKNDYAFPFSENYVTIIRLVIPEGYRVKNIPQNMEIETDDYAFSIRYTMDDDSILYHKEITIKRTTLPKSNFRQWNTDIGVLRNAYLRQVTLEKI